MPALHLVPYGPPAARTLRDAIIEAKHGDPLAPVTVAVPSNYAGLSLRRSLGVGELSLSALTGREGLVNVRFIVLSRVAELLGAPALAAQDRRPLTSAVRAEAIRAALAADPGVFRDVAAHTATERSLDMTLRDLRRAPEHALPAIEGQGARAATVVRVFRHLRGLAGHYYDEEDLADAAADAVAAGSPALRDIGHVVLYLPRRLSPSERRLVEALAAARGLKAIVGVAGDEIADEPARQLAAQLRAACGSPQEQLPDEPPAATGIVAVTDAEEEVRFAIRHVMGRLAAGTPLHRMAVLYPNVQPYALLLNEQFEAAGVPHNGPAVRTLAQTLAGRTLLGALRLRESGFRRVAVMDWLSAAPVLEHDGRSPAPAHRWDVLSRAAAIVAGAGQWRDRLERHRTALSDRRQTLEGRDDTHDWQLRGLGIELEQTGRLATFMAELDANLQPRGGKWHAYAGWARKLLERYLGGQGHMRGWPDQDVEALRTVEDVLETLANLDDIGPPPDDNAFRKALERELEAPASRIGRFGDGVFTGRVRDASGTDFDLAIVLGMTEGAMPPRRRDDPLLPDRERVAAGEEMPLRTRRQADDRRDYLAALAAAAERLLVFPRADLRGQRGKLPARWLLESASRLANRRIYSGDLDARPSPPWLAVVPSFEGALADGGEPASEQEYALRSLLRWRAAGEVPTRHYLASEAPELRAGLDADIARLTSSLTRWDGSVGEGPDLAPSAERPVSPTALQNWAACPRRYLLGNILHVAETLKPEDTLRISPLERGNLFHAALERFISEESPVSPNAPWSEAQRARLLEIAEELCRQAEASGVTGRPLLWRLDRARIMRDLAGFLDADEALRLEHGVVPVAAEFAFGVPDASEPPVIAELGDGRRIAFRGRIDRVDRAPDGSRLLVLDYKSGSSYGYKELDGDPVRAGTLLQLPIYALAARQRYGDVPTEARYWFATEQQAYDTRGYEVTEDRLERFRNVLATILNGIGAGLFPARPGKYSNDNYENCLFCPYDRVCPQDRSRAWERKRDAADLHSYVGLVEPKES